MGGRKSPGLLAGAWGEHHVSPYGATRLFGHVRYVRTVATVGLTGRDPWTGEELPAVTVPACTFRVWRFAGQGYVLERPWEAAMRPLRTRSWARVLREMEGRAAVVGGA